MLRKLGGTQEEKSVILRSPGGGPRAGTRKAVIISSIEEKEKGGIKKNATLGYRTAWLLRSY